MTDTGAYNGVGNNADENLRRAYDFIESTDVSVFLTGKAGTGKTTFLRNLVKHTNKTLAIVAPSGVAAVNAGGVTIHSFFQLPLSPYIPGMGMREQRFKFAREKKRIIQALDVLVIDEISMVRSDLLDAVDDVLRRIRGSQDPFGGVQLLMIGDLRQLSPIVTEQEAGLLRSYYDTPYFFGSHALRRLRYVTISLRHVFRQKDDDFVQILNDIRDGHPTAEDLRRLNSRLNPSFEPPQNGGYIRLTTHNRIADNVNNACLKALQERSYTYSAHVEGTYPETSYPTEAALTLKVGAQVMFIKNDSEGRFYNGKIGYVSYADAQAVKVRFPDSGEVVDVEPMVWENTSYTVNSETNTLESTVSGRFRQMPLRLAWAITIHKSQGLTFDHAIIDAGASFAPGQVYVALSRCRTLEGMVLSTPITAASVIEDSSVTSYIAGEDARVTESIAMLPELQRAYRVRLLCDTFRFTPVFSLHQRLCRILNETYSRMFRDLTERHVAAHDALRTEVIEVADKWIALLSATDAERIADAALQERIRRSAKYFAEAFERIFGDWYKSTAGVRSDNKDATRRVGELYEQFDIALRAAVALMRVIAEKGFDPTEILRQRRETLLAVTAPKPRRIRMLGEGVSGADIAKNRAAKTKKAAPRVLTHEVSAAMVNEGKNISQIAAERGITADTVTRHIVQAIRDGKVDIRSVVNPMVVQEISDAILLAGRDAQFAEIMQMCIRKVSYNEIRLVKAWLEHSSKHTP